jgi:hypothetical protein
MAQLWMNELDLGSVRASRNQLHRDSNLARTLGRRRSTLA